MKTYYSRLTATLTLLLVLACGLLPFAARAQSSYKIEIKEGSLLVGNILGSSPQTPEFLAKFGTNQLLPATLGTMIDILSFYHPDANIIFSSPNLRHIQVGDLKYQVHEAVNSELEQELEALSIASEKKFVLQSAKDTPTGGVDPTTGLPLAKPRSLFVLTIPSDSTERGVEVFSLNGYLQQQNKEGHTNLDENLQKLERLILETYRDWQQNNAADPSFRFHLDSKLLVVIGSPDAIDIARKVIKAMPGQSGEASHNAAGSSQLPAAIPATDHP